MGNTKSLESYYKEFIYYIKKNIARRYELELLCLVSLYESKIYKF